MATGIRASLSFALGEPYADDNENGAHDSAEYFLDFNNNGASNPPDPSPTAFKGIICTGNPVTCSTSTLAIGASHLLIMSTAGASVTVVPIAGFGGSDPSMTLAHSTSGSIAFNVEDLNTNPIAAGTTISVTAE